MPAYWVARSKINDPVEYKKYTDLVPGIIAKFGGKVLARGGRFQIMEGPAQIPSLHRDRISDPGAGRRLFHLAGIRPRRGIPAQRRRRGRNHHGGGGLTAHMRLRPTTWASLAPAAKSSAGRSGAINLAGRPLRLRCHYWIPNKIMTVREDNMLQTSNRGHWLGFAGAASRSRPARCSWCPPARKTRSRSRSASAWRRPARSAPNGKQALLGMKIWEEETNAKGGLLGRPVKLVYYDDQIESVDGAGHLHQAARRRQSRSGGRRLCHQHGGAGHAGRHAEEEDLHQPVRARCERRVQLSEILLGAADRTEDQAVVHRGLLPGRDAAESEADRRSRWPPRTPSSRKNACDGARANAKKFGFKIVYDKSYPPTTTDFSPIVRAMQATNADIVVICSYPLDLGRHGAGGQRGRTTSRR